MESSRRRRKKAKNQKLQKVEKQRVSEGEPVTPTSENLEDEAGPSISKKASATVLKKALDKKAKRVKMSTKETKTREEIAAGREAKKLAKQKAKNKNVPLEEIPRERKKSTSISEHKDMNVGKERKKSHTEPEKSQDEVDKAVIIDKNQILAERAAKQAKKAPVEVIAASQSDMTVKDVVETLRDIKNVAKDVKEVTAKVQALDLEAKKEDDKLESGKTKAELKAERRAKQEAQRAAKQAEADKAKPVAVTKPAEADLKNVAKEKTPKRAIEKKKPSLRRNCFGQEYIDTRKHLLQLPINSNIHTAFVNLGVQLAAGVIRDSNARFVALLDALKKLTKDYSLPPKTEFSRGLEAHLTLQLKHLASMSQTEAAERNAVKFYRHLLTQLPHNVTEYEAKAHLQDEIDRYISEQIDKAGEAISAAVRSKISQGDNVLTYGFSSLVERILIDTYEAGVQFNTFVCGAGAGGADAGAREMERRLAARSLSVAPVDIRNVTKYMCITNKVVLGATSVLNTGGVVAPVGTAVIAQHAHASNVPVLVACETHKFSEHVHTDAFCNNTLGDPGDIIDASSELFNRPANPDLVVLNLTYDVTPPKFVTAVVTELAILPCSSAPIVHRIRSNAFNA